MHAQMPSLPSPWRAPGDAASGGGSRAVTWRRCRRCLRNLGRMYKSGASSGAYGVLDGVMADPASSPGSPPDARTPIQEPKPWSSGLPSPRGCDHETSSWRSRTRMRKLSKIAKIFFTMDQRPQRLSHLLPDNSAGEGVTAPGAPGSDPLTIPAVIAAGAVSRGSPMRRQGWHCRHGKRGDRGTRVGTMNASGRVRLSRHIRRPGMALACLSQCRTWRPGTRRRSRRALPGRGPRESRPCRPGCRTVPSLQARAIAPAHRR